MTVARVGSPAGTMTHTTRGAGQRADQALEAVDVADVGVAVVPDDLVTGAAQTLAHVAAHLAQADQSELHRQSSFVVVRRAGPIAQLAKRTGIRT